jgi:hypothetical protein
MLISDLLKRDLIYFIDIETVNDIGICQIGITKWDRVKRNLSIEFNKILNPDVPPESINTHAINKHTVSEYQWSTADTFAVHYLCLKELLNGNVIIQWGGNDLGIINKNISRYNLDGLIITSLNCWNYLFNSISLDIASETINIKRPIKHHAAWDSYLTGLLFVKKFENYEITKKDLEVLHSLCPMSDFNDQPLRVSRLITNGTGKEVCLTGFTDREKKEFANKLAEMGFKIRGDVTKGLNFLIVPSKTYIRSPKKEEKAKAVGARIIDLNTFLEDINKSKAS